MLCACSTAARKEKMKRQAMKKELDKLKGEFAKLKGMVQLTVALLNLQNHGTPTDDLAMHGRTSEGRTSTREREGWAQVVQRHGIR